MALELTFKQVCELVKKDGREDPELIKAVDNLLGLVLVCSPLVIGPAAAAFLPLLAAKNELVKTGKFIFDKLSKKQDDDYIARQQRMQVAYGLLCFTAFFDALDRQIPKNLRDRIRLLESERKFLAKSASRKIAGKANGASDPCHPEDELSPLAALALPFPHPTESLAQQVERHAALWKQLGEGFQQFIQNLAFWDEAKEKEQAQIRSAIGKVPEEAAKFFEAQYFQLACSYPDFAIWANLHAHKNAEALIARLSGYVIEYAALSATGKKSIDIGFAKLHDTVLAIPETLRIIQAADLVASLTRHYEARVDEPIIEDKDEPQEDKPCLYFPRIRDAFIPQFFKVLRQTGKARRLEDEATWEDLPNWGTRRRDLMGRFLSRFKPLLSDIETENQWARIKSGCEKKGRPISFPDAWIAAAALQLNIPLVTHNASDYEAIEGLTILTARTVA